MQVYITHSEMSCTHDADMANYSLAQCMTWGARQGCSFVHSRCGKRRDDLSIQQSGTLNGSKRGSCNRHYQRSYGGNHYMSDPLLVAKCGAVDCCVSCPSIPPPLRKERKKAQVPASVRAPWALAAAAAFSDFVTGARAFAPGAMDFLSHRWPRQGG